MPGHQVVGEHAKPWRRAVETGDETVHRDEGPVRVTLVAGAAQPEASVTPELTAAAAEPGWVLGRPGMQTDPAPPG
jgi:hypothetical protein